MKMIFEDFSLLFFHDLALIPLSMSNEEPLGVELNVYFFIFTI